MQSGIYLNLLACMCTKKFRKGASEINNSDGRLNRCKRKRKRKSFILTVLLIMRLYYLFLKYFFNLYTSKDTRSEVKKQAII